ncbi:hypothetical protein C4K14_1910 [Pseudomonas chlororaphis subsp. aureofaciens]|uniref:hypothetical protein n=1 Tax=Pseudomonas chlororaphis TaxID=587753 RepID=UPI000F574766|nr:hypothetical protein [Pseudomonas chlororaphis]AZD84744.1 hypothetical protein C4K14_1910 [Pseudomonas chlororaphis subsp. aureofaciens]
MLKKILAASIFLPLLAEVAVADVRQIDEDATVKAIGSPVLKKTQEEDTPGCNTSRYKFGDKTFDMTLQFKCNRINVGWTVATEPEYEERSKQTSALAQRAVAVLTGESGIEVERVLAGGKYDGRTFSNGLSVSGSCVMNSCLLTFK